jgi:hypothetical protein
LKELGPKVSSLKLILCHVVTWGFVWVALSSFNQRFNKALLDCSFQIGSASGISWHWESEAQTAHKKFSHTSAGNQEADD